jgi:hypothetical protein
VGFGVADLVITFFLKIIARAFLYLWSIRWKRATAVLTGQSILDPFFGCPSVKLCYRFTLDGHERESWSKVPMLTMFDAKQYVGSLPHNMPRIIIRVNRRNPEVALFFDLDQ